MDQQTRKTLFGSAKGDWGTPQWLYDILNSEFDFGLDAAAQDDETYDEWAVRCANAQRTLPRRVANWKHPNYLSESRSAFGADWAALSGGKSAFLNPPYGRVIGSWTALAKHWGSKIRVACLVPARTDTRWFWETCLDGAQQVRLLRGRLQFQGATETAPFPSAVVVYGPTLAGMRPRHAEIVGWDPPRPKGVVAADTE